MLTPTREWNRFESDEEKLLKLKEWGLVSPKANQFNTFVYKGIYKDTPTKCDVVGYVDDNEVIIAIDGEFSSIHPTYLKDMQSSSFNKDREVDPYYDGSLREYMIAAKKPAKEGENSWLI